MTGPDAERDPALPAQDDITRVAHRESIVIDASPDQAPHVIANRFQGVELPDPGTIQINNVSIVGGGPLKFSVRAEADEEASLDAFRGFLGSLNL